MDEETRNDSGRTIKDEISRIAGEVLLFLIKLAVAALFLLVDWGIKSLSSIVLEDPDGFAYRILALVLDTTFVGTAAIISVTGAITIAAEFTTSAIQHIKGLRKR